MITKEKGVNSMSATLQHLMVDVPQGITAQDVQEAVVAFMYDKNKLDLKEAREIIGATRREFEEDVLPKYGFNVMGDNMDDEINEILNEK